MENASHKSSCENGQKGVWPTLLKRDAPCQQNCIQACFGSTWETPSRSHEWSYCDTFTGSINYLDLTYHFLLKTIACYIYIYLCLSWIGVLETLTLTKHVASSLAAIQGALSPIWNQQSSCWEACPYVWTPVNLTQVFSNSGLSSMA